MIKGAILDLDGTVYLGGEEIQGASHFVTFLQKHGLRCLFVTNRANRTPGEICKHLNSLNIPCEENNILTSAQAVAKYIQHGSAFYIGEEALKIELVKAGIIITEESPDYVVVSFDRYFTYKKMEIACSLIAKGAEFIATNPDKCLRTDNGVVPGTGAIAAAIAVGSGVNPVFIGKPHKLLFDLAVKQLGLQNKEVIAIGDNIETDILAGKNADVRTVLMLTGISSLKDIDNSTVKPTWVADNYETLTNIISHHIS